MGQGRTSDRENEHLGASDEGVIMLRKRFLMDLRVIEDGGEPKGILRDPSRNHALPLPRTGGGEPLVARRPTGRRFTVSALYYGLPKEIEEDIARVFAERGG